MTCGIMTYVFVEGGDGTDLVDDSGDGGSIVNLHIIIVVRSPTMCPDKDIGMIIGRGIASSSKCSTQRVAVAVDPCSTT